jgi:uncharacterized membrane protein HdeD (DUF308 family)
MTAPRPGSRPGTAPADQDQQIPRQQGPEPAGEGASTGPRGYGPGDGPVPPERMLVGRLESLGDRAWQAMLTVAVLLLAVGVLLVAWPAATLTIVAILLGAGLVIAGLYRFIDGIVAKDMSGGTRTASILIGLLALFIGLYCLRHHDVSVFLLALLVGIFWIMHGFTDLAVAATAPPRSGRGWLVVAGLFSIAAGAVVLFWPGISLLILLWVLGFWLIVYAVMLGVMAFGLRRATKRAVKAGHSPVPA